MPRTAGGRLHDEVARMADRAAESREPWWLVSLSEPTDTLFAARADHADAGLMAVLYSNRLGFGTVPTDRRDVACVRTDTPICVLGVGEQFMRTLLGTLRANGCHGLCRRAGTEREYRF